MSAAGSDPRTLGDLLGAQLRALGVRRVYRAVGADLPPVPGLPEVHAGDPSLASILADASGRIDPGGGGAAGAALLPGRRLRLSSAPGLAAEPVTIDDPADLAPMLAAWTVGLVHTAVEFVLDLDLAGPAPAGVGALLLGHDAPRGRAVTLDPALAEVGILILAGPGVLRSGPQAVDALHEAASVMGAGVLNTWGAKGLYRWDDPHHHGTVGLQARDFELAGVHDGRIVVAVGIDPVEAPEHLWQSGRVVEVGPEQLVHLALRWERADPPPAPPPPPPLYGMLRQALAPLYADDAVPFNPARAAADLADARPPAAIVVADPGPAGLWIARTLPTTALGSVVVPATMADGFAAAAAIDGGLDGREVIAVTHGPLTEASAALLDLASSLGVGVTLEVWGVGGGPVATAAARRAAVVGAVMDRHTVSTLDVPVDFGPTSVLEAVAGEVIAWSGPR